MVEQSVLTQEIDMEERKYTYAELCRMKKSRVIRIAGFKNMNDLLKNDFNKEIDSFTNGKPLYVRKNASKKYIAKIIASDR